MHSRPAVTSWSFFSLFVKTLLHVSPRSCVTEYARPLMNGPFKVTDDWAQKRPVAQFLLLHVTTLAPPVACGKTVDLSRHQRKVFASQRARVCLAAAENSCCWRLQNYNLPCWSPYQSLLCSTHYSVSRRQLLISFCLKYPKWCN